MKKIPGINTAKEMHHLKRDNNILRQDAMTFSCLGKLSSTNSIKLDKWRAGMKKLIRDAINENEIAQYPLVIGLAESGIVPSALFHQLLREEGVQAQWVCSTRRASHGIRFAESHSHSPDHILPLPGRPPSELWFVEDEITTGRTILHLALNLCRVVDVWRVRIFSIADTRSSENIAKFNSILEEFHIEHSSHAMIQIRNSSDPARTAQGSLIEQGLHDHQARVCGQKAESGWHFPGQRPALNNQLDVDLDIYHNIQGCILVVGEAIDIGLRLVQMNPNLSFRHVTLSPWVIDGENIFSRLDIGENYYLYNFHDLESQLYLLYDPMDRQIGMEVEKRLAEKGLSAEHLKFPQAN